MSRDGNEADNEAEREAKIVDRLDALLSARMDDDLTPDERLELEALIAGDPDHAARALVFENIDVQLRSLAKASIDEDSLATAYAGLRTRLAIGGLDETGAEQSPEWPARLVDLRKDSLGGPAIPLLLAVAAAFVLYLAVPTAPLSPPSPPLPVDEPGDFTATSDNEFGGIGEDLAWTSPQAGSEASLEVEDELVLVLGYGDEMSELQGITRDDLDVIEQLELLDFLSDREQAPGVLGEMGERG